MLFCRCVIKHREDRPRYGKTVSNYFLDTFLLWKAIFCENWLFKSILMKLLAKVVGEDIFKIIMEQNLFIMC